MNEQNLEKLKEFLDGDFGKLVEEKRSLYASQLGYEINKLADELRNLTKKVKDSNNYMKVDTNSEILKNIACNRLDGIESLLLQVQKRKSEINGLMTLIGDDSTDISQLETRNKNLNKLSENNPELSSIVSQEINKNQLIIDMIEENQLEDLRNELDQLDQEEEHLEFEKTRIQEMVDSFSSDSQTFDYEKFSKDNDRINEINSKKDLLLPYLHEIKIDDLIAIKNNSIDNDKIISKYSLHNYVPVFSNKDFNSIEEYNAQVRDILYDKLYSNLMIQVKHIKQEDLDAFRKEKIDSLKDKVDSLQVKTSDKKNYLLTEEKINQKITELNDELSYYTARIDSLSNELSTQFNAENALEIKECFEHSSKINDTIGRYKIALDIMKGGKKLFDGEAFNNDKARLVELEEQYQNLLTTSPQKLDDIIKLTEENSSFINRHDQVISSVNLEDKNSHSYANEHDFSDNNINSSIKNGFSAVDSYYGDDTFDVNSTLRKTANTKYSSNNDRPSVNNLISDEFNTISDSEPIIVSSGDATNIDDSVSVIDNREDGYEQVNFDDLRDNDYEEDAYTLNPRNRRGYSNNNTAFETKLFGEDSDYGNDLETESKFNLNDGNNFGQIDLMSFYGQNNDGQELENEYRDSVQNQATEFNQNRMSIPENNFSDDDISNIVSNQFSKEQSTEDEITSHPNEYHNFSDNDISNIVANKYSKEPSTKEESMINPIAYNLAYQKKNGQKFQISERFADAIENIDATPSKFTMWLIALQAKYNQNKRKKNDKGKGGK